MGIDKNILRIQSDLRCLKITLLINNNKLNTRICINLTRIQYIINDCHKKYTYQGYLRNNKVNFFTR